MLACVSAFAIAAVSVCFDRPTSVRPAALVPLTVRQVGCCSSRRPIFDYAELTHGALTVQRKERLYRRLASLRSQPTVKVGDSLSRSAFRGEGYSSIGSTPRDRTSSGKHSLTLTIPALFCVSTMPRESSFTDGNATG
jgi:hypothetical protein